MSTWIVAVAIGFAFAALQYGRELRAGWDPGISAAAALRAAAVSLLVALLLDAPAGRARALPPWVALDESASWLRGRDTSTWQAAKRAAMAARPDSFFLFGSALRVGDTAATPADPSSLVRPATERALSRGHPLVVITDGELDDTEALETLPTGSSVEVFRHPPARDLGLAALDAPRAIVSGDTIEARVGLAAGGLGTGPATLTLSLDGRNVSSMRVDSLAPWTERMVNIRARIQAAEGHAVLRAAVAMPGDVEPRNDTLAVGVDIARAAGAVFVSTSPDFDSRYALSVLRGALAIPTRGFLRVAPGAWRVDGSLSPASESDVRQAVREAPFVILHGDTAVFGAPAGLTRSPLALLVPSSEEGEWYVSSAPLSPLATALSGVPWDSLPPVTVSAVPPHGAWNGLEARRGREGESRVLVAGSDVPRRVVVAASGMWRWQFRGGVSRDAFTAFWGGIFDWLSAERADRRSAVPDDRLVRAGEAIRWRRGSSADSLVPVVLRRRGDGARVDSMTLRFPSDASIVESPGLAPGVYDVSVRGGSVVLAVNPSRELLPRSPRVKSGAAGGSAPVDTAPRLRAVGWAYALVVLLLCAEWIVRRRRGMR